MGTSPAASGAWINVLGIVKRSKNGLPRPVPLEKHKSWRFVESNTLKSMEFGMSDEKTSKKTMLKLRRLEQNSRLLPKITSKTSWKDTQKCPLSSFIGITSETALTSMSSGRT